MTDRPIIMSAESVKAILDGKKTMTRRVITLKGYHRNVWDYCVPHNGKAAELLGEPYLKVPYDSITDNTGNRITCPYGQVGDRLWVRETWQRIKAGVAYKANWDTKPDWSWKSPIFMPRWTSRITLEITGVRVERVQEIKLPDVRAEGYEEYFAQTFAGDVLGVECRRHFIEGWERLNYKRGYGWMTNPWCWVISFKKEQKDE